MPNPKLVTGTPTRKSRTRHSFDCQVLRLLATAAKCYASCTLSAKASIIFCKPSKNWGNQRAFRSHVCTAACTCVHTEDSTHDCYCSACQRAHCVNRRWVLNNLLSRSSCDQCTRPSAGADNGGGEPGGSSRAGTSRVDVPSPPSASLSLLCSKPVWRCFSGQCLCKFDCPRASTTLSMSIFASASTSRTNSACSSRCGHILLSSTDTAASYSITPSVLSRRMCNVPHVQNHVCFMHLLKFFI